MSSLYIISCLTALYSEHLQIYTTAVELHNFIWSNFFSELNMPKLPQFQATLHVHVCKILGNCYGNCLVYLRWTASDVKESVEEKPMFSLSV